MAELLLEKGYEVYGIVRRSSSTNCNRISHLIGKIHLMYADLTDSTSIEEAVRGCGPNEIYNLGAMSFVPASWSQPLMTFDINCLGLLRLIKASEPYDSKIYQASTSEMYGNNYPDFKPISPYGISKLAAHHLANAYRNKGRFICCGICFNHESPRRGEEFVTQKIARFAKKHLGKLTLGNLEASRDWGFAGDYVEAMWLMMQQPEAEDYEICTGKTHTIKEFLDLAIPDWKNKVEINEGLKRPNEVNILKGNPEKIKSIGWEPKVDFKGLVEMMCRE
jgi:GDPmannose 4,6-dehydratase